MSKVGRGLPKFLFHAILSPVIDNPAFCSFDYVTFYSQQIIFWLSAGESTPSLSF